MTGGLSDLSMPTGWADLGEVLHDWVVTQRWFGGKAREGAATEIADTALLPGETDQDAVLVVLLAIDYGDGAVEHYHLPLVADPASPIGTVGRVTVGDAAADPRGVRTLAAAAAAARDVPTTVGSRLVGTPHGRAELDLSGEPRWLRTEQSNSAAVLGERWFVKVFRRLELGPNPDVELTSALTDAGFAHVPAQAGALTWGGDPESAPALVMLTRFEADATDAWQQAVADAAAVARGDPPPHAVAEGMADLGRVIAELHGTLADRLGTHEIGHETLASWVHGMQHQLDEVLDLAAAADHPRVREIAELRDELRGRFEGVAAIEGAGTAVRVHGDLHLGQLLRRPDGTWMVLDFEGEPARGLSDRRRTHTPLRDVAGMVRSFDYAACHGVVSTGDEGLPPALHRWRDQLATAFVDAHERALPAELLPAHAADRRTLRAALVLDKAIYELGYELNNRPSWAAIPADGIRRVLADDAEVRP